MGDRANVLIVHSRRELKRDEEGNAIRTEDGDLIVKRWYRAAVGLYTHWGGSSLKSRLAAALDSETARDRWDDDSYLTRILISQLVIDHDRSTGTGVYPYDPDNGFVCPDNEHDLLVVDVENQRVLVHGASVFGPFPDVETLVDAGSASGSWSFEAFIEQLDHMEA